MVNFLVFDYNFITYYYLNMLSIYYTNKQFLEIHRLFNSVNTNIFLSEQEKKKVFSTYYQNIRLKYIVDKITAIKKIRKQKCINKRFLNYDFTYKTDLKTTKIFADNVNFYKFTNNEIIKIIYNSLCHQEESISEPKYPKNPYNGIQFNFQQLSKFYTNFIIYKEKLPIELIMFKSCNFDIENLIIIHKNYFNKLAIKNWLKDMNEKDWLHVFKVFYKTLSLRQYVCYKCILDLPNYKSIFLNFVAEYYELINCFKSINIDFIERLDNIIQNLNIEPESKHITKHRIILKTKKYPVFKDTKININFCNKTNTNLVLIK
uniref:Uncharacterized protein n=1 Tax=viral metagenome TaxID=1070528 RepID=A0A6C0J0T3_9ZZZZ